MSTSVRGRLDVQLHQIDQRRPAGDEPNVRALLRGVRLAPRSQSPAARIAGRVNSKGLHGIAPARG